MTIGTKSVLFGAHCWFLHPWFVAWAWWKLYGFPWDPRLWLAFFTHDLGYLGQPNMDGPEGEQHPWFGARVMSLFDGRRGCSMPSARTCELLGLSRLWPTPVYGWSIYDDELGEPVALGPWGQFALFHSRFVAKASGMPPSRLCAADKLAIALTPAWLYLPMARVTGELAEYRKHHDEAKNGRGKYAGDRHTRPDFATSDAEWYARVQDYCRRWAWAHRDGGEDTWTSGASAPKDAA